MGDVRALTFGDLVAPMSWRAFLDDYVGKGPLHVRAEPGVSRQLLTWERLNELLEIRSHWTDAYLKLIINGNSISRDRYCDAAQSLQGPVWRADPGKVHAFLSLGATLIANMIEDVAPELKHVCETLSMRMGGQVTANVYASSRDVGGFGPHFDTSDVMAFQCEGEKVWRIYEGRADNPTRTPSGPEQTVAQQMRVAAGKQVEEIVMRPGDTLYLPRGWYHDAKTISDASLHVTFAVKPLTGGILFRVLEQAAMEESAFRAYVPDASWGNEGPLRYHIEMLADRLRELAGSPNVINEIRRYQQELRGGGASYALPVREKVREFRSTGRKIELVQGNPPMVRVGNSEAPVGAATAAASWVSTVPGVVDLELYARFRNVPRSELDALLDTLVRLGALTPSTDA